MQNLEVSSFVTLGICWNQIRFIYVRKLQLMFIPFKEIPIGYLIFVENFEHFDYVISSYRLRSSLPNKNRILIDSACFLSVL